MVAKKKKEEQTEEQTESGTYHDRALQRLKDQGDTRVPSDLDHFQPADIPPDSLTAYGKGEKTSSQT